MKKRLIIFGVLISMILVSGFVSAQNLPSPPVTLAQAQTFVSSVLSIGSQRFGEMDDVVARLLLFLMLAIVLYKPAEKIIGEEKSNLALALAVIVSIIGVRFMSVQMVKGLFLPSAALGIMLSMFVPIALFGAFIVTSDLPKTIRRSAWWMFAGVCIALWWLRGDLGDLDVIYFIAAIVCIVGAWFDGTIQAWWYKAQVEKEIGVSNKLAVEVASRTYEDLAKQLAQAISTSGRLAIIAKMNAINKDLKRLTSEEKRS